MVPLIKGYWSVAEVAKSGVQHLVSYFLIEGKCCAEPVCSWLANNQGSCRACVRVNSQRACDVVFDDLNGVHYSLVFPFFDKMEMVCELVGQLELVQLFERRELVCGWLANWSLAKNFGEHVLESPPRELATQSLMI